MELAEVPEHLLVLGGGYVGLEFAQMFRRFGSRVTVVQRNARLLPREDEDVAEGVADILREDGIDGLLGTSASSATRGDDGGVALKVHTPEVERTLEGSQDDDRTAPPQIGPAGASRQANRCRNSCTNHHPKGDDIA